LPVARLPRAVRDRLSLSVRGWCRSRRYGYGELAWLFCVDDPGAEVVVEGAAVLVAVLDEGKVLHGGAARPWQMMSPDPPLEVMRRPARP
jgi:hypothetical protein